MKQSSDSERNAPSTGTSARPKLSTPTYTTQGMPSTSNLCSQVAPNPASSGDWKATQEGRV